LIGKDTLILLGFVVVGLVIVFSTLLSTNIIDVSTLQNVTIGFNLTNLT